MNGFRYYVTHRDFSSWLKATDDVDTALRELWPTNRLARAQARNVLAAIGVTNNGPLKITDKQFAKEPHVPKGFKLSDFDEFEDKAVPDWMQHKPGNQFSGYLRELADGDWHGRTIDDALHEAADRLDQAHLEHLRANGVLEVTQTLLDSTAARLKRFAESV